MRVLIGVCVDCVFVFILDECVEWWCGGGVIMHVHVSARSTGKSARCACAYESKWPRHHLPTWHSRRYLHRAGSPRPSRLQHEREARACGARKRITYEIHHPLGTQSLRIHGTYIKHACACSNVCTYISLNMHSPFGWWFDFPFNIQSIQTESQRKVKYLAEGSHTYIYPNIHLWTPQTQNKMHELVNKQQMNADLFMRRFLFHENDFLSVTWDKRVTLGVRL